MSIIDKYILKRYLATFVVMLGMFIPIGITVDVSEKVGRMLQNEVAFPLIAQYYLDFTVYFANLLFPIFLFLSVIWFTSKLANNTEIIAILSSGISFTRFLRPYLIGASLICVFSLLMGFFVVPGASEGYNNFRYMYLKGNGRAEMVDNSDVYQQISDNEFIHVSHFNQNSRMGSDFTLERFNGEKLVEKITAERIKWSDKKNLYILTGFKRRVVGELSDRLEAVERKEMKFNFNADDLTPTIYVAETLTLSELYKFIDREKTRGSSNVNRYLVVLYRKYSIPVSAFILTIIAVAVSSMKRRGGMGVNLAIGITLAFAYVFFDKVFGVLAEKSSMPPFVAVWIPNFTFGILAVYLLRNAKR